MQRLDDEKVLVLDFGSQYAQLIARRVRQQHVYCEIVRHDITAERIRELAPKGMILSGGPASVYEPGAAEVRSGNLPPRRAHPGHLLWPASRLPGARRTSRGHADAANTAGPFAASRRQTSCWSGVPDGIEVWMSHGDQVSADFGRLRVRWPPPTPAPSPR